MFKDKMNYIIFEADKGSTGGGTEGKVDEVEETKDGADGADTKKEETLTVEEVQKMIQSEVDRTRGEYSKKLREKESELEELRLSQLSDEERKSEELKNLQKQLSEREAEATRKELTLMTIELLKEEDLPIEAKDFLIGKDEDAIKANIEGFKKMFSDAVEATVTERFKDSGKEHKSSTGKTNRYTQEDLNNMSPAEINANWEKIQRDLSGQ